MLLALWLVFVAGLVIVLGVLVAMIVQLLLPVCRTCVPCATGATGCTGTSTGACEGCSGPTGPTGLRGATGPAGAAGLDGPTGAAGQSIRVDGYGFLTQPVIDAIMAGPPDFFYLVTQDKRASFATPPGLSVDESRHLIYWDGTTFYDYGYFSGPSGATGPGGPTGLPGSDGATGPTGAAGFTGPTGAAGVTGLPGPTGATPLGSLFGDGQDGDVHYTSNATLIRDMRYRSFIIDAGVTLFANGYAIHSLTTGINNGTISCVGGNGGDAFVGEAPGGPDLGGTGAPAGSRFGGGKGGYTFAPDVGVQGEGATGGPSPYALQAGSFFKGGDLMVYAPTGLCTGTFSTCTGTTYPIHDVGVVTGAFGVGGFFGPGGLPTTSCAAAGNSGIEFFWIGVDARGAPWTGPTGTNQLLTNHLVSVACAFGLWNDLGVYGDPGPSGIIPVASTQNPLLDAFFSPTGPYTGFCADNPAGVFLNDVGNDFRSQILFGTGPALATGIGGGSVAWNLIAYSCTDAEWSRLGQPTNTGSVIVPYTCPTGLQTGVCMNTGAAGFGGEVDPNDLAANVSAINGSTNPLQFAGGLGANIMIPLSGGSGGGGAAFNVDGIPKAGGGGGGGVITINAAYIGGNGTVDVHGGDSGLNTFGGLASGGGGGGLVVLHTLSPTNPWTINVNGGRSLDINAPGGINSAGAGQNGRFVAV